MRAAFAAGYGGRADVRHLLETVYVLTPDSYVYHRNENLCISIGGKEKASVPAKQVEAVVFFGKNSVSTPLLWFCSEHGISIVFLNSYGRFYARVCGPVNGNVLLRKKQYETINDTAFQTRVVRNILNAKLYNSKNVLMRHARNCKDSDADKADALHQAAIHLSRIAQQINACQDADSMRGLEGAAATVYFSQFDTMLSDSCGYQFEIRSRRPPRNEINAVLSFVYTQLTHDIRSALETVGLDPAAGYFHTLRPGRPSFALDLIEELRAPLCDRFVLSLFNRGQLTDKNFEKDGEAVYLNDKGRRIVLNSWRTRKQEQIQHPFLREKIPIGLIPYTQAMLFARVLCGDLDEYPPFVWR